MVNFMGQLPGLICDVRMGLFLLDVGSSVGSSEGRDNNNTGALDNRAQQMDSVASHFWSVVTVDMDIWTITNIRGHC